MALAILAALFEIAVFPRTYSYPKIVAYAFAFWLYGRYVARRTRAASVAMAAGVAIAFMFRHDHGLFLGARRGTDDSPRARSGVEDLAARGGDLRRVDRALFLCPYLLYVQATAG